MSEKTFLVEIGTEELPPKALRSLAESFAANFTAELDNAGLAHGTVQWFADAALPDYTRRASGAGYPRGSSSSGAREAMERLVKVTWRIRYSYSCSSPSSSV